MYQFYNRKLIKDLTQNLFAIGTLVRLVGDNILAIWDTFIVACPETRWELSKYSPAERTMHHCIPLPKSFISPLCLLLFWWVSYFQHSGYSQNVSLKQDDASNEKQWFIKYSQFNIQAMWYAADSTYLGKDSITKWQMICFECIWFCVQTT